jgi:hypothetical protein
MKKKLRPCPQVLAFLTLLLQHDDGNHEEFALLDRRPASAVPHAPQ